MTDPAAPAPPPAARLMEMVQGIWLGPAICWVARLGLVDRLVDGPKDVSELAAEAGLQEDPLYRLLRAVSRFEVVDEVAPRRFAIGALGQPLRRDDPAGVGYTAHMSVLPEFWDAWGKLGEVLEQGGSGFRAAYGHSFFEHLGENPEVAAVFDGAMTQNSARQHGAVLEVVDVSGAQRIVEVAGGEGRLLAALLDRAPEAEGVLLELPHVLERARARLDEQGVLDRCQLVAGDFLEAVPEGGDLYVLKHIVHDWDDARAGKILANIRRVMDPGGRVLILDALLGPPGTRGDAVLLDLEMLVMTEGGRERSEDELRALLAASGLALEAVHPTPAGVAAAVARPA